MQAWLIWGDYMEVLLDRPEDAFVVIGTRQQAIDKAKDMDVEAEKRGMPEGYLVHYVVGPITFTIAIKP